MYVRENVEVGMLVRCCKTYEEIHVGDIGKIIKIDREALHDLNLQVILEIYNYFWSKIKVLMCHHKKNM